MIFSESGWVCYWMLWAFGWLQCFQLYFCPTISPSKYNDNWCITEWVRLIAKRKRNQNKLKKNRRSIKRMQTIKRTKKITHSPRRLQSNNQNISIKKAFSWGRAHRVKCMNASIWTRNSIMLWKSLHWRVKRRHRLHLKYKIWRGKSGFSRSYHTKIL